MKEYAQPVILLGWENIELRRDLEIEGAEVNHLPNPEYGREYLHVINQLDIYHKNQVNSPTTAIDERRKNLLKLNPLPFRKKLRNLYYRINHELPWQHGYLLKEEQKCIMSSTNIPIFLKLLEDLKIDSIFSITPFLHEERLLLRAAKEKGISLCTSILSFDNLTTRGWIPVIFDLYLVWNAYNEAEVNRTYNAAYQQTVDIIGAPQMDFYWDSTYVWPESDWRKYFRLPSHRPVILFGGGPPTIAYHEPDILKDIDEAISTGEIPEKPVILFRKHPNDTMARWASTFSRCQNIIYDDSLSITSSGSPFTNITRFDIEKLSSTLAHSNIHINTSSTMTIDGAIFDRPQIGPAYDNTSESYNRVMRELYEREHFLPIVNSHGLVIANNRDELIADIKDALLNPSRLSDSRKAMVKDIITFSDGQSTKRLDSALRKFILSEIRGAS